MAVFSLVLKELMKTFGKFKIVINAKSVEEKV